MTSQAQMTATIARTETSGLVKMARQLQHDLSDEATIVMGEILAALAQRMREEDFLSLCADLDGVLTDQAALADPIHY